MDAEEKYAAALVTLRSMSAYRLSCWREPKFLTLPPLFEVVETKDEYGILLLIIFIIRFLPFYYNDGTIFCCFGIMFYWDVELEPLILP